jgi:hypothetical protein
VRVLIIIKMYQSGRKKRVNNGNLNIISTAMMNLKKNALSRHSYGERETKFRRLRPRLKIINKDDFLAVIFEK